MKIQIIKSFLSLALMLIVLPEAHGKSGMLMNSLEDAMSRSSADQNNIKRKALQERSSRMDVWAERTAETIEINNANAFSGAPGLDIGIKADLGTDEGGLDTSGLNGLRSDVEEESTDINFDDELREVSLVDEL